MDVELIALPYDSARRGERMGAGPEHLLRAGLGARLEHAGHAIRVRVLEAPSDSWRAEIRTAFDLAAAAAAVVRQAIDGGGFPLVLSGNCAPAALGCVSGIQGAPAVLWFDAHGDFNTPETTIGGFLDGMALATVAGRCWTQLSAAIPNFEPVPESAIGLLGARDLDPLERTALDASAVRRIGAQDLRARLPALLKSMNGRDGAYLHLDLDVLDPGEARVNSYAAPNGLSLAELEWAVAEIAGSLRLGAASITALDPGSDASGAASAAAISVASTLVAAVAQSRGT